MTASKVARGGDMVATRDSDNGTKHAMSKTKSSDYNLLAGAGEGNRTLVFSLEGCCSTIELHPRLARDWRAKAAAP
jgi:hypothetical protein